MVINSNAANSRWTRAVYKPPQSSQDIAKDRQTAQAVIARNDPSTEGPEHQARQLETLKAEGDTHNGQAQDKATCYIPERCGQTAKDQPDKVAYKIHKRL